MTEAEVKEENKAFLFARLGREAAPSFTPSPVTHHDNAAAGPSDSGYASRASTPLSDAPGEGKEDDENDADWQAELDLDELEMRRRRDSSVPIPYGQDHIWVELKEGLLDVSGRNGSETVGPPIDTRSPPLVIRRYAHYCFDCTKLSSAIVKLSTPSLVVAA